MIRGLEEGTRTDREERVKIKIKIEAQNSASIISTDTNIYVVNCIIAPNPSPLLHPPALACDTAVPLTKDLGIFLQCTDVTDGHVICCGQWNVHGHMSKDFKCASRFGVSFRQFASGSRNLNTWNRPSIN